MLKAKDGIANCYYATVQKPTAVSACVVGNFTHESHLNLLVARYNYIDIYTVTAEGLKLVQEVKLFGVVVSLNLFRPAGKDKDQLFVLTKKFNAMILEAQIIPNQDKLKVTTLAHGNVSDKIGRPSEAGPLCIVEPQCRFIGLRLYDGYFKVVPVDGNDSELRCYNIRCDEHNVIALQFLYNTRQPTLAVIYQEQHARHLKTLEIDTDSKSRDTRPAALKKDNIDTEASMIIPVKDGGCIIIGSESLTYLAPGDGSLVVTIAPDQLRASPVLCWAPVDDTRFLLGDQLGRLFMLLLMTSGEGSSVSPTPGVTDIKLELLGDCSIAQTISYLDNGVVFIGSRFGDSQLVRLSDTADENHSYVQVLDSYTNIGPILDMVLIDPERQGQSQLITCSGAYNNGTLRIIRQGVGIQELASIELAAVRNVWSAVYKSADQLDNVIVLSFVGQTKFLLLNGEEVEETQITGLQTEETTLYCGTTPSGALIQVTERAVYLAPGDTTPVSVWVPPNGVKLTVTSCNGTQIVCAAGSTLFYFTISATELELKTTQKMAEEVACLDISLRSKDTGEASICAVGLWREMSALLLSLPSLDIFHTEKLETDIIPRSVLLVEFFSQHYLLVSLGDGSLIYYRFSSEVGGGDLPTALLRDRKKVILGSQPLTLRQFTYRGQTNVFAVSDRPTVIYSSSQKLVFASVNLAGITSVCAFNSAAYPESLVFATATSLTIGSVVDIQKLHMQTIVLRELPKRIAYQEETGTFAVLTTRKEYAPELCPSIMTASMVAQSTSESTALPDIEGAEGLQEREVFSLLIFDEHTMEILHAHTFAHCEYALSICSVKFVSDNAIYYVVGTAVDEDDEEPHRGRISVFQWNKNKLVQIFSKEVKGAPYTVTEFGGRLLATVNSAVRVYLWNAELKELQDECSHYNQIIALTCKTRGDFILIGDIMRSMSLLNYKSIEGSITEVAKDINPCWMTAVELLSDEDAVGAEQMDNLFVVRRSTGPGAADDPTKTQLVTTGKFHNGDFINVIRKGQLGMHHLSDSNIEIRNPTLIAGVSGSIATLCQLPSELHAQLRDLEKALAADCEPRGLGLISHSSWRAFSNDRLEEESSGFVDGDLLQTFLDFSLEKQTKLVENVKIEEDGMKRAATPEDFVKILEELSQLS